VLSRWDRDERDGFGRFLTPSAREDAMKLAALSVALLLVAGPARVFADDLDDSYDGLKQALTAKDFGKVKSLAAAAHTAAKKYEAPAPADVDKESYEGRAKYAKEVDAYAEYALYTAALESPKEGPELIAALEQQNAKSQYLEEPPALYIEMENAVNRKQQERAVTLASRLIAAVSKKSEGIDKDAYLGRGYFIIGINAAEHNKFLDADKNLRAAVPLIKGNNAMLGPALFYLGVANYNLANLTASKAKMLEAVKFSEQAAAIPGPTQDQAYKNSLLMKDAAAKLR
jgi:hypothetical protein